MLDLIEKKKLGREHTQEEIDFIIKSMMDGKIPDYQISAWLMAIYFNSMTTSETAFLTRALIDSGEKLDFSHIGNNLTDKHSTGGVGDKVTLILIPLLASMGIKCAKISGRSLGHTGGTIDKLESIEGFNCALSLEDMMLQVDKIGAAIVSQSINLTPADGKLYALRDVTSTVDSLPLICASVISKKIASGANHIIIDVKYGSGAFVKTLEDAKKLSKLMEEVAAELNHNIRVFVTPMNEPLGRNIGNSLEVIEAIEFLKGNMADDLKDVVFELALCAMDCCNIKGGVNLIEEKIKSGDAIKKLAQIIEAQGGNSEVINNYNAFRQASIKFSLICKNCGTVKNLDALKIALACKALGAGRDVKTDKINHSVGIVLNKKTGMYVDCEDVLLTIYADSKETLEKAADIAYDAYEIV